MFKLSVIIISIICLFAFQTNAQQNILLLSGKRILVKDSRIDTSGVVLYKTASDKVKGIDISEVFSVTRADSVEVIVYKPECSDVCFKIDQMRDYLTGISDGKKFKDKWSLPIVLVVGGASGFFIMPTLSPIVPALSCVGVALTGPKPQNMIFPDKYKDNQHYIQGYCSAVKKKRIRNGIIGGGIGLVLGITSAILISK